MAEFGEIQGLAVPLQFDQKINDLRYRQQQMDRAKAMSEAKAALFADDLNYQNAVNSHDNPLIKAESQNTIKQIGKFVRENPDLSTNVDKRIQLNELKRTLKDSPTLHRALASDAAYKTYVKDMAEVAKNPQQHDTEAYKNIRNEWENYLKYGNQGGEQAAREQGKQAFLYNKPRDFVDLNKAFQETGNSFKDLKTRPIKGGRNAYEEFANPNSLRAVATQMYDQNRRQIDLEAVKRGVNPITLVEEGINAHIAKKRDFGDYGLSDALTLADHKSALKGAGLENPSNAFQEAFVGKNEGVVPPEYLEQTYGSKPKAIIFDNKGQNQIDITGNRIYYTGGHKYVEVKDRTGKPHKQKLVETYTYLPFQTAKDKGIIEDPAGWSGNSTSGYEVSPEWNKQAELETSENDKGETIQRVRVKSLMPVEMNAAHAGAFNQQAHIAKSKLMSQSPEEGDSIPTGTADQFKASGWSDAQIQEGVNSGKIKVR